MLPQENRLRKEIDHKRVFEKGRKMKSPYFILLFVEREDKDMPSRYSFVVSKKIDKRAVVRNRIRRVLREAVKQTLPVMKNGYDCIIIPSRKMIGCDVAEVLPYLHKTFKDAGLLNRE